MLYKDGENSKEQSSFALCTYCLVSKEQIRNVFLQKLFDLKPLIKRMTFTFVSSSLNSRKPGKGSF